MQYVGYIFISMLAIGALTIAGTFFNLITLPWLKFDTKVTTNQQIIKKTYDANNVLYNYEWFKDRYEAIIAIDSKIEIAQKASADFETDAGDRTNWTFEDKNEAGRLRAVTQGLRSQKEDLVAEYNARAKMANRNIFQDNLPLFIDLK